MARRRWVRKIRRKLPAGDGDGAPSAELRPRHGGCESAARSPFQELVLGGSDGTELLQVSSILYGWRLRTSKLAPSHLVQHSECLLNSWITQVAYLH
ncbi:unnamed protein product [Urochloa humidicola]